MFHSFKSCDQCENPASVHLTEIRSGKKTERHLCEACAKKLQSPAGTTDLQKLLQAFDPSKIAARTPGGEVACKDCGMTFSEFKQNGRFGCSNDYEAFAPQLDALFKRLHGHTTYTGPRPEGGEIVGGEAVTELRRVRKALGEAIDAENYEEAARLRDEIQKIEDGGSTEGGEG